MNQVHRNKVKSLSVGVLALSMTMSLQAFAVGDSGGTPRNFGPNDGGDNPNPFPFYDFRWGQYKAECVSGGPVNALYVEGSTQKPMGIYCTSPFSSGAPVTFYQAPSNTTPYPGENNETFASGDSADYGNHGTGDWDWNHLKGECPATRVVVGIAKTADSSEQLDTIHCASTTPMCSTGNIFKPTNTCHTVVLPVPGPNQFSVGGCNFNELVVGVSVDQTYHHPHAVLCCAGEWVAC